LGAGGTRTSAPSSKGFRNGIDTGLPFFKNPGSRTLREGILDKSSSTADWAECEGFIMRSERKKSQGPSVGWAWPRSEIRIAREKRILGYSEGRESVSLRKAINCGKKGTSLGRKGRVVAAAPLEGGPTGEPKERSYIMKKKTRVHRQPTASGRARWFSQKDTGPNECESKKGILGVKRGNT